jgi:arginine:agmatine antiporter
VFWAYLGLECANAAAAIVRNPARDVPIAAVGGVILSTIVYVAASVAVMGVLPAAELARSTAPFADVVGRLAGGAVAGLVAACAMAKAAGTLGGWLLVTAETSRSAADEGLWFRRLSSRTPGETPVRDLLVAGTLTSLALIASASPTLSTQVNNLINWSVVLTSAVYGFSALALLRWSREIADSSRRLGARALAVGSLLFVGLLIFVAGREASVPAVLLMAATVPVYFLMRLLRRRSQPVAA